MDRSSLCSFMFAGSSVSRAKGFWEKNCFKEPPAHRAESLRRARPKTLDLDEEVEQR